MSLNIASRVFTVERQFVLYAPEQFDELYEFLYNEHGVTIKKTDIPFGSGTGSEMIVFQSQSGSTSHYIHAGDFIVIDESGEVRAVNEKDEQ